MCRLYVKRQFALLLISLLALAAVHVASAATPDRASQKDKSAPQAAFVDGIAAVVNQNVITLRQLDLETRNAQAQLQRQNIPMPDHQTLQKQVLQRMIAQELERQEAVRMNITVTDDDVQQALQSIAQRNNLTNDQFRREVEKSGMNWDTYLKELRQEVQLEMLRQRVVDGAIIISDAEVDAFLRTKGQGMAVMRPQPEAQVQQPPAEQPRQTGPRMLGLGHILVAVPERASPTMVSELRQKAESILARIKGGADFAGLAVSSSDGPQALDGGNLGVRPIEGWPDLFVAATKDLSEGQVSGIIQSGNGFHILKVLVKQGTERPAATATAPAAPAAVARPAGAAQGSTLVTQTHARHILVRTSQVMTDEQAEQRLLQLRQRLTHGENFADLAKRYSDDTSAPQGGDLGWLTPGETVPAFQQAMDALEPGQISAPVHSQFGWHLIEVLERRTKDMEDEFKRMQARQILFQQRVEPTLEDWLSQLRGQAYIENRLDPSERKRR